jgi:hypothetical protein
VRKKEDGEGIFRLLVPVRLVRLFHADSGGRVRLRRLLLSVTLPGGPPGNTVSMKRDGRQPSLFVFSPRDILFFSARKDS